MKQIITFNLILLGAIFALDSLTHRDPPPNPRANILEVSKGDQDIGVDRPERSEPEARQLVSTGR